LRKIVLGAALVLSTAGLVTAFAGSASAFPTRTTQCSGCHSGVNVPVTATQTANNGTTATYSLSAPTASAIAVFNGSTKLATFTATSGSVSVPVGGTYTIFAVRGPGTSDGLSSTSVSPVAPAPTDTTAPVTTSNAVATYVSSAAVALSASDNAGGSGVAATYYRLDGGAQTAGTSVSTSALGSHTLEFWSVDVAGNVETHKTVSFTVTAPVPVDATAPVTTSNAVATYVSSAAVALSASDNAGGSGVAATYYRLDGGAQTAGTSVSTSALGSHTLEFWSVDVAGNVETHKTVTFTVNAPAPVDTTAPVTTSNAVATYVSSAAITLSRSDNAGGSGIAATYYRLDGGPQTAGTSVSTSALGSHSLEFWSVDVAGNVETHKTVTFTVNAPAPVPDVTAPVTTSNAVATYVSSASIALSRSDNAGGSGIAATYYILDGGAQTAGTMVSVDTTGTHTLEFWSVDVAGNVETHKTVTFAINEPAPTAEKQHVSMGIKSSAWRTFLRRSFVLSGYLAPGTGNESVVLYVKRPGSHRWVAIKRIATRVSADGRSVWSYRYKATRRGTYRFQVRFAGNDTLLPGQTHIAAVRVR